MTGLSAARVVKDLPALQQLHDARLAAEPDMQRMTSTLVMKDVVINRSLTFAPV